MKFSLVPGFRKLDKSKVTALILVNQLVTPGAGSLIAGRWVGYPQLALATTGTLFICLFFFGFMADTWNLGRAPSEFGRYGPWGKIGVVTFAISWFWTLATSISMFREAARKKTAAGANPTAAETTSSPEDNPPPE